MEKRSNGRIESGWEQVKGQLSIMLAPNQFDVKQTKKNEATHYYPTTPNFDDQIISKEAVLYDVFVFGDTFHHFEMSSTNSSLQFEGIRIELMHENLFFNQQKWETPMIGDNGERFFAVPHESLKVFTTNLPYDKLIISENKDSDIAFPTTVFAIVGLQIKNNLSKEEDFYISLYVNQEFVYLNEHRIFNGTYTLRVGDRLIIGGIAIEYRPKQLKLTEIYQQVTLNPWKLLSQSFKPEVPVNFPDFRRSPRILLQQPTEKIAIQLPESLMDTGKSDIIRTILPSLGMLVASGAIRLFSGGNPLMMVGVGSASLLTVALSVSFYFTNKKDFAHKKAAREENYQSYLLEKNAELEQLAQKQQQTFDYHFPDLEKLSQLVTNYSPRIYEKTVNNADYLEFSLGTGELTSSYEVVFDDEQTKDPLVIFAKEHIIEPYSIVKQAPIRINIQTQTLGLVGPYAVLRTAVSSMLFQLASFHSYHDLEFIALLSEEQYDKEWKKWRWLPHFQIHRWNLRGLIHNAQSREMVLNRFYQLMNKRKQVLRKAKGNNKIQFSPHIVFTILEDSWLAGHGVNEFLAEDMSDYGVTVIWGKEVETMLPETVTTLVKYISSESGQLVNEKNVYLAKDFTPYHLPERFPLDQTIRRLANLHHVAVEKNTIPESVGILEMYQVKEVEELQSSTRWQAANTAKSLAVPLGYRGKEDLVSLNLHECAHGPHGLVAGTTGSGKSEIVQSYVLSLAINFAPEDVGFLLIDFKGGGMTNLFANLPHLLGSITNLDGAGSARTLASIRAELQKRQRYFGKYGVNHINGYTKLYKAGKEIHDSEEKKRYPNGPLPHLFLISDEFAELKADEPEFMAELVSTARIGRSLGVHLILATQKPSGVVDDQIWSNSRFKLALKVQNASDSNEILKTPDAANITLPGRVYLQVGNNEIYELFQSAWSGATYNPESVNEEKVDERIWKINDLGQHELLTTDLSEDEDVSVVQDEEQQTELEAIVDYLAVVAKQTRVALPEKPWLPPLETQICTPTIFRKKEWQGTRELTVPFAFMDIPSRQAQETFFFDFNEFSHTVIYGSAGFGKSVALQTLVMNLARRNTPEQLHVYLLDFGTNGLLPLKDLPHVVDLVRLEENEKLVKCVKKLRQELIKRKEAFSLYGVSSLSQYESKSDNFLPVEVIVLDSYDPLRESLLEEVVESVLNQLLREGASLGMYLVATGLRADSFKISMTSNLSTRIALYLVEENAVKDIVGRDALISQEITGRIQLKLDDPIVMQVYLPIEGSNDIERLNNLEAEIKEMNQTWSGDRPTKIPMAPKHLTAKEFYSYPEVEKYLSEGNLPFGMSLETTEVVAFSPVKDGYCVIVDDTPSQTEFLNRTIMEGFKELQQQYYRLVFDYGNQFESTAAFDQIVSDTEYNQIVLELLGEIDNRVENNATTREKMLVYIPEVVPFSEKSRLFEAQVKKMLKNAAKVGIYFIFQSPKSKLDSAFDDVSKILRNNPLTCLVGSRLTDQEYIKVKSNFSEPELEYDQHNFYAQRKVERIKLISEW